jgi:hypothetical protein
MNFTITKDQLSDLHNSYCYLRSFKERMESMLSVSALTELNKSLDLLNKVRRPIMDEYDRINDMKNDHYEDIRSRNGFKSIWSLYDATNLFDLSGFVAEELVYSGWGNEVRIPLPGGNLKWWDLYVAAEKAINASGDTHHIFIEAFRQEGNKLYLHCGS